MIGAQQVVDTALAEAARLGNADETIVLVTDRADAALRWAGNSMTTNGESVSRTTTVISIVRQGDTAHVGSVRSSDVDPAVIADLVAASQQAAAGRARGARQCAAAAGHRRTGRLGCAGAGDRCASVLGAGRPLWHKVFGARTSCTGMPGISWRRRSWPRRTDCGGGTRSRQARWRSTPNATAPARGRVSARPTSLMCRLIRFSSSCRRGWAGRSGRVELPAGRYETIMPPSTVADMMIYLAWSMDGRGAQEGRTALSAPGGGTRVGEKLTELPLTLYSDPAAAGLECTPFVAVPSSSERVSVFDNGMDIGRVDWIRDGTVNALAYPRAAAAEFDAPVAVPADNLLMTGGSASLADMIAGTERGLLLTTLWYIRTVDPTVLLLTGLTRDGVYLVEDGEVTAAVNNFRFNESPLDLLRRATEAGVSEVTLPREWGDWATRAAMPSLRIPDFHMSSVSQAQ